MDTKQLGVAAVFTFQSCCWKFFLFIMYHYHPLSMYPVSFDQCIQSPLLILYCINFIHLYSAQDHLLCCLEYLCAYLCTCFLSVKRWAVGKWSTEGKKKRQRWTTNKLHHGQCAGRGGEAREWDGSCTSWIWLGPFYPSQIVDVCWCDPFF